MTTEDLLKMTIDKIDKSNKHLLEKLDEAGKHLAQIDRTLIKQESNLEKHMLRTEQNEKMIQLIYDDLKPVKKHIAYIEGILKFLGAVSLILGIVYTLVKLVG